MFNVVYICFASVECEYLSMFNNVLLTFCNLKGPFSGSGHMTYTHEWVCCTACRLL